MIREKKHGFEWVDRSFVEEPQSNLVSVRRNNWWLTNEIGQVLLYWFDGRPFAQCNVHESVARGLGETSQHVEAGVVDAVQIPLAFVDWSD